MVAGPVATTTRVVEVSNVRTSDLSSLPLSLRAPKRFGKLKEFALWHHLIWPTARPVPRSITRAARCKHGRAHARSAAAVTRPGRREAEAAQSAWDGLVTGGRLRAAGAATESRPPLRRERRRSGMCRKRSLDTSEQHHGPERSDSKGEDLFAPCSRNWSCGWRRGRRRRGASAARGPRLPGRRAGRPEDNP